MLKAIALLTRKSELTREEFIEHYERSHVPLILRSFPQIVECRRNFVDLTDARRMPGVPDPGFDCITEMWFKDRTGYEERLAMHADPAVGGPLSEDANQFIDMSKTIQFVVDVRDAEVAPRG